MPRCRPWPSCAHLPVGKMQSTQDEWYKAMRAFAEVLESGQSHGRNTDAERLESFSMVFARNRGFTLLRLGYYGVVPRARGRRLRHHFRDTIAIYTPEGYKKEIPLPSYCGHIYLEQGATPSQVPRRTMSIGRQWMRRLNGVGLADSGHRPLLIFSFLSLL